MPVIRIAKRDRYTTIPNPTLRDDTLSLAATGLLTMMLSYPDDWRFNYTHLISMKTNGRDAFKAAMRELITAGYVRKAPKRNADGTVDGWEWEVLDEKPTVLLETRQTVTPSDGESTRTKTERPTKTEKTEELSSTSREEHLQTLVNTWNALCGALPSVKALSAARRTKLRAFIKEAGGFEKAQEILRNATLAVARDDWWIRGKYGLDNLLAGGKVFQRAESYEAQHSEDPTIIQVEVGNAIRAYVPFGNRRSRLEGLVTGVTDAQVMFETADGKEHRVPRRDVIEVLTPDLFRS